MPDEYLGVDVCAPIFTLDNVASPKCTVGPSLPVAYLYHVVKKDRKTGNGTYYCMQLVGPTSGFEKT